VIAVTHPVDAASVQRDLARLAELHREQAELLDRVVANLASLVEGVSAPPLMDAMSTTTIETVPILYTVAELASMLRVDERTLRELRRSGEFPAPIMIGTRPRWRRVEIEEWLASRSAK
jgi:excisionase family DNA binding protein